MKKICISFCLLLLLVSCGNKKIDSFCFYEQKTNNETSISFLSADKPFIYEYELIIKDYDSSIFTVSKKNTETNIVEVEKILNPKINEINYKDGEIYSVKINNILYIPFD